MKNKIFLTDNLDLFLMALYKESKGFNKISFYRGLDSVKDYCFQDPNDACFLIKIDDDDNFEIRYRLRSFPSEDWGEIHFDLDQVLCLLVLYSLDGSVQNIELHTTLMNITLNNKIFYIRLNYFKDNKVKYKDYVDDVAKRMQAKIIHE
jgi:hypothetical protein